jgi:polysaccharide export outer membrane protein
MIKILFYIFCLCLLVTSCVPTKDLIYLQNKENASQSAVVNELKNKPYRLQSNDVLSITIKSLDPKLGEIFNLSTQAQQTSTSDALYMNGYIVDDHGAIRIPVLGEVNVMGSTVEEARIKIETMLLDQYFKKEAELFVIVKLAGFRYTVNGEVLSPGSKILFQDRVNILEAVANSGDITTTGDRKDVKVMRQFPHGLEIYSIDLTDVNALKSPYFYLQPNDYVYVKPLKQKSWGTGKTGVESLATILSVLTLATTTFLLFNN